MKTTICTYQKKMYNVIKWNGKTTVILITEEAINNNSLFDESVRVYETPVDIEELDELYDVKSWVVYKGLICEPWSLKKILLEHNRVYITASNNDKEKAIEYGFRWTENCYYEKEIRLDEVEEVIIKITWHRGKEEGTVETWKTDDIYSFLENNPYY